MRVQSPGQSPLLVLISAPSGGGKTTVCRQLLAADPRLARAVTCTTRAPRNGEQDGVDYHFLRPEVFHRRVRAGEFLEHATVHGQHYGTLREGVIGPLRRGQDVLLNVDVQGAVAVRAAARGDAELRRALVTVFLTPPSLEVLAARLRRRASETEEAIRERLAAACRELEHWPQFDYLLVSTTIPEDLRRMQVILEAERMRPGRAVAPVF